LTNLNRFSELFPVVNAAVNLQQDTCIVSSTSNS